MRLVIAAIGVLRRGAYLELADDYAARVRRTGPAVGISNLSIIDGEAPKSLQGAPRQDAEAKRLLKTAVKADRKIAMDERGRRMDSAAFARLIGDWRDAGVRETAFLIGGADGLRDDLRNDADAVIAMGDMTWPHQLARVMLCEQLYRAVTILAGYPYHRE